MQFVMSLSQKFERQFADIIPRVLRCTRQMRLSEDFSQLNVVEACCDIASGQGAAGRM